jgi:uncharacterized protein Yka (UPF0111/DUF47 family)
MLANRQREIIDVMQAVADRLHGYHVLLVQLPISENLSEIPDMVRDQAETLADQVSRLREDFR